MGGGMKKFCTLLIFNIKKFDFRIYLTGVVYTLTWQFAQFVSLLQALMLFILATLGLIDRDKVSIIT